MTTYYLDIETIGLNPQQDKIITIQYARLERNTGKSLGPITILKEWELGEKQMLEKFIQDTQIHNSDMWNFIAVGYNLKFEHTFLYERCKIHGIFPIELLSKPFLDLRAIGIMMNKGEFKDSGLDKLTNKPHNGSILPEWYQTNQYYNIENYIRVEFDEFENFLMFLFNEMPNLLIKFRNYISSCGILSANSIIDSS